MRKGDVLMNLSTKILIGLGLGIIAGLELGAEGVDFAKTWIGPFGTIFMNMIKMIIVPLVFSSLVIGVCSLGDIKKIGRIGGKTMAYYLGTTAFAIVLGIALGTVMEPGAGVNMPTEGVKAAAKAAPPIMKVITDIFPTNAMEAMLKAKEELAQVKADTEKKLKAAGSSGITVFKVHFEAVQGEINKMLTCIDGVEETEGKEEADKLRKALKSLCQSVQDNL